MFSEQSKVQIERQEGRQSRPPGNPRWTKGVSGNPAGAESKAARRARIDQLVNEWAGETVLKSVERDLLRRAAELFLYSKPKTIEDQARIANTIGRLVAQAGLANARHSKPTEVKAPSLREYLAAASQSVHPDAGRLE
jgi:hypothetical protein